MGRMMLFGLSLERWLAVIAWSSAEYGFPRYKGAVEAILWCKLKWEQAQCPEVSSEQFELSHAGLFYRALAKVSA